MSQEPSSADSSVGQIRLRYWASARAAAGVPEDLLDVDGTVTLEALRLRALRLHEGSARFAAVLSTCSFLVEDRPVTTGDADSVEVQPGQTVEFLPPFAGG